LNDVHHLSIAQLGSAYARGELTPVEVATAYLERIRDLDPVLQSHITVTADAALEAARASGARHARGAGLGPLDGVPLGLKDLYDTAGVKTTAASPLYAERVPVRDATVVRRLKEAGAVLLGKHTMNEFASGRPDLGDPFPPPRNPWNVEMASGGSSSGSAVAVAAGLCAGAFGSDTGGSIRLPASNCGVVGLKPTNGRVSLAGVIPLSWSLDVAGPIARTVDDAAILLQAVAGQDSEDPGSAREPVPDYRARIDPRTLRVGVPLRFVESYPGIDAEALASYHQSLAVLRSLGMNVETITMPDLVAQAKTVFPLIMLVEALAYHQDDVRAQPDRYGRRFFARLQDGAAIGAVEHARALRDRTRIRIALEEVMRTVDVIATPTVPWPHRLLADTSPVAADRALLTFIFNLSGQPAISVPSGFTADGMPLGLQLAARSFEEPLLFAAAAAFEREVGSASWHPKIAAARAAAPARADA
jgi:aspartyl-tRNA(Asn)/glutamyl-tRNA(Gln) amidotransferase subunit A